MNGQGGGGRFDRMDSGNPGDPSDYNDLLTRMYAIQKSLNMGTDAPPVQDPNTFSRTVGSSSYSSSNDGTNSLGSQNSEFSKQDRDCKTGFHPKDLKKVSKTSKYRGVYWNNATNKWRARMWINGKSVHIGNYATELEAANAFDIRAMLEGRHDKTNIANRNMNSSSK